MNLLYKQYEDDYVENSCRWFRKMMLIYLAMSSTRNQLVSAFTCKPKDILYKLRFTSMIIAQISGFIVFLLGVKYTLLNHVK